MSDKWNVDYPRVVCSLHMTENGDGTGNDNANVDGSVTPVAFKLTCPSDRIYEVHRAIIFVQDTGTFTAVKYGVLPTLTNGVLLDTYDVSGVAKDQIQHSIKSNSEWAKHCYDATPHTYGSGDNAIAVRWTFSKSGEPIYLKPGESLRFTVQDDLTGLVVHSFIAQFTYIAS